MVGIDGIKSIEWKIQALIECTMPKIVGEVKNFLMDW